MASCWGSYIHMEPLTTLRAAQTTAVLTRTVTFFRGHNVDIAFLHMDNQKSVDLMKTAKELDVKVEFVSPYVHQRTEPNVR